MKQNILVVDDHRENLIALEAILDGDGRNLIMAQSGNEALSLALKHDFALVLLDVQMPEMDGFEVAELMRKNKKTRNLPIIFVTAISKEQKYVFKGYECGAVDYLFKPIDQKILEAKVNVFLELDRQRKKLQQAVVQMKRLKDENERLLHALGEALVGADARGRITFCNEAACALLSRQRDELVGEDLATTLFNDDTGKPRWEWKDSPVRLACEKGESWKNEHSLYAHDRDGLVALTLRGNAINDDNGNFTGLVLVVRVSDDENEVRDARKDHRRNPRKKLFREMVVFDRSTGGNVGRLMNLSVDGFKLFTRRDLPAGENLQLGMVLPDQIAGVNTVSFDARAVWAENLDAPGEYQVGFQFVDLSPQTREVIVNLMDKY
ncbi:MAG: PAS domain S-box protein [Alcanivoracaceae bacterium]|uniref:response regulator n=1 Tax=Alcanivorax sp. MD8A TaxID=1177157 RepID=UPI000C570A16|nr:response regulator [Alcanivorax sp. MD8A]MAX56253.1 PAS domain S-box protein [Alcanivoracaceae bacterium]MCG8439532.1 response regulator [Pseudomonadales bacterium]MED5432229.1 response regulator [Pseudomonadota bacterium]MEE2869509.1 response regulator [Pseudomonadota bacterium]PNE01943.1 sensory box protein/response regulator [Alcanivorax sp. MD8A]|tara:strand:- start:4854 stop:5990 length:1137 start_codon:yes stop_codon:yes gene_type:complete